MEGNVVDEWFICCAVSGFILGLRWPIQALLAAAVIAFPVGFICQLRMGLDIALMTAFGGVVVLQICYVATMLAAMLISHSVSLPSGMVRVRPRS